MGWKSEESQRLAQGAKEPFSSWRKWGAYVSERSWGSVREDYSSTGEAWTYLTHDMARSKAYRWGEDGLAGLCDYFQTMVFSFVFWNGKDPILKERLFGLNPYEGNHGEDVKECYYYVDATPTQSYLKYQYKYPQAPFPYDQLVEENGRRSAQDREFEIQDTGVFDQGRYFDCVLEYAKASPEDICIRLEVFNRGDAPATIHILPQLVFRNRWSWGEEPGTVPLIEGKVGAHGATLLAGPYNTPHPIRASFAYTCPPMYLYGPNPKELLFTHNETNNEKIWGSKSRTPYVKDAFHRYLTQGEKCLSPEGKGSKAALHYEVEIGAKSSYVLHLRFAKDRLKDPLADVESLISLRRKEADAFYEEMHPKALSQEDRAIQRGALAGMIWSQQVYIYDVQKWLAGDNSNLPPPKGRGEIRNGRWSHLYACDVISMPDKWEYPWFASWDLAFHSVSLSLIDCALAKEQVLLLLRHWYQHVNGQIPAYEWSFSDLNPPVQAWALWKIYLQDQEKSGKGDRNFLLFGFLRLVQNFSWWVNKVDRFGNNFFEGGFLGLDNISVIDRSDPLSGGRVIEQSDATGWMGLYSLMMMRIALELAKEDKIYQSLATTFFENFIYISSSIHDTQGMWDEKDGFFYDVIWNPDGKIEPLKIRSFVGIIPFYSLITMTQEELESHEEFWNRLLQFRSHNQAKVDRCFTKVGKEWVFSLMSQSQMDRVLARVFDPEEFLSDYGLRSISKYHEKSPLIFCNSTVKYEPGESLERIKGGNSNWRGPIWIPTNYLFLDALSKFGTCYGVDHEIATSMGQKTVKELHKMLKTRLASLFRQDASNSRPVHGECKFYKEDPNWKDLLLYYEHYHGDTGRGLGASHQTGWSGLIANILNQVDL